MRLNPNPCLFQSEYLIDDLKAQYPHAGSLSGSAADGKHLHGIHIHAVFHHLVAQPAVLTCDQDQRVSLCDRLPLFHLHITLGNIDAKRVIIGGEIYGNLNVPEKVELTSTARLIGDIVTNVHLPAR